MKTRSIKVRKSEISANLTGQIDYISLSGMSCGFENVLDLTEKWLRNKKHTIEFIGQIHNPAFNSPEFEGIKNGAVLNRFSFSVNKLIRHSS